jgi:hypothetical protein
MLPVRRGDLRLKRLPSGTWDPGAMTGKQMSDTFHLFAVETQMLWNADINDFVIHHTKEVLVRSQSWEIDNIEKLSSDEILDIWGLGWLQDDVSVECDSRDAVYIVSDGRYGPTIFAIRRA